MSFLEDIERRQKEKQKTVQARCSSLLELRHTCVLERLSEIKTLTTGVRLPQREQDELESVRKRLGFKSKSDAAAFVLRAGLLLLQEEPSPLPVIEEQYGRSAKQEATA
jgi:hypothetical protein